MMMAIVPVSSAFADGSIIYPPECVQNGEVICARLNGWVDDTLNANGYCVHLKNNTSNDFFIPLRTGKERDAFLNSSSGLGIEVSACCVAPHCGSVSEDTL